MNSTPNIKEIYDKRYHVGYMANHRSNAIRKTETVLREIKSTKIEKILDYGCGQGSWTPLIYKVFPFSEVTGYDISSVAVNIAKERFPQTNFTYQQKTIKSNKYDLIFSYHVLEHVADLHKTIQLLSDITKSGGYLLVILPCSNKWSFSYIITNLIKEGFQTSSTKELRFFFDDPTHLRRPMSRDLTKQFKEAGFSIIKEYFSGQLWGAVEWITKTNSEFINRTFNYKCASSIYFKPMLFLLKHAFLLLNIAMTIYPVHFKIDYKSPFTIFYTILLFFPKTIAIIIRIIIESLAYLEWTLFKTLRSGDSQYLLCRRL